MHRELLFEEYRLIERSETEINGAWKGAHLLLFFLAFVFGSFCTFCFHMLMYLFDEKCVLFPKLLSLTSLRHNVIYEFMPSNKDLGDMPVDFLSTQWVEKSTCALPTYVPLVSGIFGLVWITMFLMCSTGSRTLTGLQRPWRVLPPVFLFSLAMGALCIYSSSITHSGLQELCLKLGEITGSSTCTYTVNVATLTYERRIRGVFQATRLTILSAWLHTTCWLLSALLALVRVLMAVDFHLVRVKVELQGDIDKILEKHETQIRTVSPEVWINDEYENTSETKLSSKRAHSPEEEKILEEITDLLSLNSEDLFQTQYSRPSELSLTPEESARISKIAAYKNVPRDKQFIVKWLYDLVNTMHIPESSERSSSSSSPLSISSDIGSELLILRQYGQAKIESYDKDSKRDEVSKAASEIEQLIVDSDNPDDIAVKEATERLDLRKKDSEIATTSKPIEPDEKLDLRKKDSEIATTSKPIEPDEKLDLRKKDSEITTTSKPPYLIEPDHLPSDDDDTVTPEDKEEKEKAKAFRHKKKRKSNLKNIGVQTERSGKQLRVQISERSFFTHGSQDEDEESEDKKDDDKQTQTHKKEKQD